MLWDQIRKALQQVPIARQALILVWKATHAWTLCWALLLLCQGLLPAAVALMLRALINRLAHEPLWSQLAGPALGMAALWLVSLFISSALSYVRTVQAEKVQDSVHALLHEQAIQLDLSFYDDPASYDLLHRARVDAIQQPMALLESLGAILQNSLGFLALAAILMRYTIWMPLLLLACVVPGLLLIARQILREHQWNHLHTGQERQTRYLDWILTDQSAAAEIRLYSLGDFFRTRFKLLRGQLAEGRIHLSGQASIAEISAGALAWVGTLTGLGWMLERTRAGAIGIGDLVLCFQVFQQAQTQLRTMLGSSGKVFRSLLFIENLETFLKLRPKIGAGECVSEAPLVQNSILFEQVDFSYPGSGHRALDGFSLEIPAGRIVALVGENGAGKSTLIKLLCRFYDPDKGRILLDGIDLRKLDPAALRQRTSVLFQEPVRYQSGVRENIAYGCVDSLDDEERVQQAIAAAGAGDFIARLPKGLDSRLGKWFGGEELSGGEWQRIALARAFFRQGDLVILDEPTSAMDSWAEHDWLRRFRRLTVGRTGLMITHRFTTAMHADVIHVMDHGRIIESGSHAELVELNGHYARSWTAQMQEIRKAHSVSRPEFAGEVLHG